MRVAVIGAGIVGVATAYELAAAGHEVVVHERRGSVAVEASFAHAGLISPSLSAPWTLPGSTGSTLRSVLGRSPAWRVRLNKASLSWQRAARRATRADPSHARRDQVQRLTAYSLERLQSLTAELVLDYERTEGHLVLLRDRREQDALQAHVTWLNERGVKATLVDAPGCRVLEPGLNPEAPLLGGIHFPGDEVGNCRQVAALLRAKAERLGAQFRFHSSVRSIEVGRKPLVISEHTPHLDSDPMSLSSDSVLNPSNAVFQPTQPLMETRTEHFDAVIVCAAMGSSPLLQALGLNLPLRAVHGLSLTTSIRNQDTHPDVGPRSAVSDHRHRTVISRMGDRLRVSGGAMLGGTVHRNEPRTIATLYHVLHQWFPGAAHVSQAQRWRGTRAMLPDGPPVLGATGAAGVWVNLGHGSAGWGMACGSARALVDTLSGRTPEVDLQGFGIDRLRG